MNSQTYTLTPWLIFLYVASVISFSFSTEDFQTSNFLGGALVVTFIIEVLAKRLSVCQSLTWGHGLFLLFVLFCAATLIFAPIGYPRVWSLALLFILSVVLSSVIGQSGSIRPVIYGVLTGLGYATLSGADQLMSVSSERVTASLGNANTYALALLIGTIFCLYNLLVAERKQLHLLAMTLNLSLIPLFGFQIAFLTGSRKGILVFCLLLLLAYLYVVRRQTRAFKLISLFGGILLCGGLWQAVIISPHYRRVESAVLFASGTGVGDNSIYTRVAMANEAFIMWTKKPLFGWGADQFRNVSGFGTYSHNNYLELLANFGIIGFIIFYGIYIYVLIHGLKFLKSSNTNKKNLGFWILIIGMSFLIMDVASVSYYSKLHWIVLSTVFGLIAFHEKMTTESAVTEEEL
jgi:O-antigen ligase